MSHCDLKLKLIELAQEVVSKINSILNNEIRAYDQGAQDWALQSLKQLEMLESADTELAATVEDCLVDILSCDNASWDTTTAGFVSSLTSLRAQITSIQGSVDNNDTTADS